MFIDHWYYHFALKMLGFFFFFSESWIDGSSCQSTTCVVTGRLPATEVCPLEAGLETDLDIPPLSLKDKFTQKWQFSHYRWKACEVW